MVVVLTGGDWCGTMVGPPGPASTQSVPVSGGQWWPAARRVISVVSLLSYHSPVSSHLTLQGRSPHHHHLQVPLYTGQWSLGLVRGSLYLNLVRYRKVLRDISKEMDNVSESRAK